MPVRNPVVVVTGASRGIGLAVTKHLLHAFNAKVVAISRTTTPELQQLASDALLTVRCDITHEAALKGAIALAEKTFHHIDGLILNAGTLDPLCRIGDGTSLAAWKTHFDVNFFSLVTALTAALPSLRKSELGGRVIFISSGAAVAGIAGWGPYNAGKAAMNSLARTLAVEEPNIVSLAVRPGKVDTEMQQQLRDQGRQHMGPDMHQSFVDAHAQGQLNRADDVGRAIASLSLRATKEMSGDFLNWDADACRAITSL